MLLVAALFVRLGFWQLDRLGQRRVQTESVRRAEILPPLLLDPAGAAPLFAHPDAAVNRRVRVRGVYEPAGEIVLRGRAREGFPGVHLATPLRVIGSDVRVWVNRGWVPAPDGATPDSRPAPERGVVEVEGLLQAVPDAPEGAEPSRSGGTLTYHRLDLATLRARSSGPVLSLYIQQLPGPALREPPYRLAPPELSDGPHLSYAVQWFSFAAIAVIGFLVLVLRGPSEGDSAPRKGVYLATYESSSLGEERPSGESGGGTHT